MTTTKTEPTSRDFWRYLWQIATGDYLLAALYAAIAGGVGLAAWLPQAPDIHSASAYAQWFSTTQDQFGRLTTGLQALGLFTITRAWGFRLLLASLGGVFFLRGIERVGQWRRGDEQARQKPYLFHLLTEFAGLLLLLSLFLSRLWGWQQEYLIIHYGETAIVTLTGVWTKASTGTNGPTWVTVDEHGQLRYSPTVWPFVAERGPGFRVTGTDAEGHPLTFKQTINTPPTRQIDVALTEEQYLAVPEANLTLRMIPSSDADRKADAPVVVQAYRSPPGRLEGEITIEGGIERTEAMEWNIEDATLVFAPSPYVRLRMMFAPTLWMTSVSLLGVATGVCGETFFSHVAYVGNRGEGEGEGEDADGE